jgi:hypothetical protein
MARVIFKQTIPLQSIRSIRAHQPLQLIEIEFSMDGRSNYELNFYVQSYSNQINWRLNSIFRIKLICKEVILKSE